MSRYRNIVYIGRYLVLTYIERFISIVCCFFSYICWSVNCMSWVSKFNNFFLTCTENKARFIFEGFNILRYGKFISESLIIFLIFLSGLLYFSVTLSVNKLYKWSLWIIEHTWEMSRNVSIDLYLRPCSIAIYGKFYLYYLYHLRLFWSVNWENPVCKLCITFWKCQDTQTLLILKCI